MAVKPLPSQELLLQLFRYEPETGLLVWRDRPVDMFNDRAQSAKHNAAIWNAKYAGKEAFSGISSEGYKRGCIHKSHFLAHRVIWKIVTGVDPDDIDHIDGDRLNNAWLNLRAVSRELNLHNMSVSKRNSSGVIGVAKARGEGSWRAYAWDGSRQVFLGNYIELSQAVAARKTWEFANGYHPNHSKAKRQTV